MGKLDVFFEKKGKTSRNSSTSSAGQSGQSTSSGISGNGSASSGYGSSRHSPSFFASSNQNSTLGRPPSRSYQKRVSIEPIEEHPTVTSYTLSELLAQAELSQYLHAFQNNLGVSTMSQARFVQDPDLKLIGMSGPEQRRYKYYFDKFNKRPNALSRMKQMFFSKKSPDYTSFSLPRNNRPKVRTNQVLSNNQRFSVANDPKPAPSPHFNDVQLPHGSMTEMNNHNNFSSCAYIIPKQQIKTHTVIGEGEFGVVHKGIWTNEFGHPIQVAVKTVSAEKVPSVESVEFLKEAGIMNRLEHEHLCKMYGVVINDIPPSLQLVTELASMKSLSEGLLDVELRQTFTIERLCTYASQICSAMQYLEQNRLIHRDLAARNILVFDINLVKVTDFGLSRALGNGKDYYQTNLNSNLRLPIAWCAPECVNYLKFTSASDVWAYGVTLWEMFSYGQQPWEGLSGNEIVEEIDLPKSNRLDQPLYCPTKFYDKLMLECWRHHPEDRPTFFQIAEFLPQLKPQIVRGKKDNFGRDDELSFREDEKICVLEESAFSLWRGVNEAGEVGNFLSSNTTAQYDWDQQVKVELADKFKRNNSEQRPMTGRFYRPSSLACRPTPSMLNTPPQTIGHNNRNARQRVPLQRIESFSSARGGSQSCEDFVDSHNNGPPSNTIDRQQSKNEQFVANRAINQPPIRNRPNAAARTKQVVQVHPYNYEHDYTPAESHYEDRLSSGDSGPGNSTDTATYSNHTVSTRRGIPISPRPRPLSTSTPPPPAPFVEDTSENVSYKLFIRPPNLPSSSGVSPQKSHLNGSSHDNGFSLPRRLGLKEGRHNNARSEEALTFQDRTNIHPAQEVSQECKQEMSGDRQELIDDAGPRSTYTNGSKFQIPIPPLKHLITKQPCSDEKRAQCVNDIIATNSKPTRYIQTPSTPNASNSDGQTQHFFPSQAIPIIKSSRASSTSESGSGGPQPLRAFKPNMQSVNSSGLHPSPMPSPTATTKSKPLPKPPNVLPLSEKPEVPPRIPIGSSTPPTPDTPDKSPDKLIPPTLPPRLYARSSNLHRSSTTYTRRVAPSGTRPFLRSRQKSLESEDGVMFHRNDSAPEFRTHSVSSSTSENEQLLLKSPLPVFQQASSAQSSVAIIPTDRLCCNSSSNASSNAAISVLHQNRELHSSESSTNQPEDYIILSSTTSGETDSLSRSSSSNMDNFKICGTATQNPNMNQPSAQISTHQKPNTCTQIPATFLTFFSTQVIGGTASKRSSREECGSSNTTLSEARSYEDLVDAKLAASKDPSSDFESEAGSGSFVNPAFEYGLPTTAVPHRHTFDKFSSFKLNKSSSFNAGDKNIPSSGAFKVAPAEVMSFSADSIVRPQQFWNPNGAKFINTEDYSSLRKNNSMGLVEEENERTDEKIEVKQSKKRDLLAAPTKLKTAFKLKLTGKSAESI